MTAHRPAQLARHTAIVLAGATSLSLTVVAGAYIVHQMADAQRSGRELAGPVAPSGPKHTHRGGPIGSDPMLTGRSFALPAAYTRQLAAEPTLTEPHSDSTQRMPTNRGGKVRLGNAFVEAQFAEAETNTLSVTVDTNAFALLTDHLPTPVPGPLGAEPSAVTTVRTDLDIQSGEVRLAFSDPTLGEHNLRLSHCPEPAATSETTRPARMGPEPATVETTVALPPGAEHAVSV
ncbi:hypothetical protein OHB12_24795 [Nocardia sp. NBC_01730]|uniref:hypothetical protein n=1 Tax=Nocardia sp. NBC_01730 TaxID=2975998 RepID=UPI002E0DD807|nr:hypothetical protein OHB12_24795 [Nocardia sp. NBC_01730]